MIQWQLPIPFPILAESSVCANFNICVISDFFSFFARFSICMAQFSGGSCMCVMEQLCVQLMTPVFSFLSDKLSYSVQYDCDPSVVLQ